MVYDHFLSEIGNFDVHRTFGQTQMAIQPTKIEYIR